MTNAAETNLFTYDADGNMTSDGRFHYFWNGENRLVCASNAEVVVTYAYDHRGRMVSKTLCSSAPLRVIIIREIVREGDSVAVSDNIWGLDLDGTLQGAGGVGGLLAVVRDDGVFFPTYDANGNVSEYVSTNGEIVAHYDYSPFGEPLVLSGPLVASFSHQFSTKPYCPVTGFSEYQMRKYRPEIGRWMSRDPLAENAAWNIYSFVNNSSVTFFDFLGDMMSRRTCPCCCVDKWTLVDKGREFDKLAYIRVFRQLAKDNFDAVLSMTYGDGIEESECTITWIDGPAEYEYDSSSGWIGPDKTETYSYTASPSTWRKNDQPGLYAYYNAKGFQGNRKRTVKRVLKQTWSAESGKHCSCPRRRVVMKVAVTQVLKNGEPIWKEGKLKWH